MIELNENEVIKRFLESFKNRAGSVYGLNLSLKNIKIDKPVPTDDFRDFKDGVSSTRTDAFFELTGWKSFSEDGIKKFMLSILEDEDEFAPVTDIDVFEVQAKGKMSVNIVFKIVYTRYEITTESKVGTDMRSGSLDKDEIIGEIELRLSEIYTLLKKLKR
jgi:hypothetical protein